MMCSEGLLEVDPKLSADIPPLGSGSQPVDCDPLWVTYQIICVPNIFIMIHTVAKLVMKYQRDNFMVGGHHMRNYIKGLQPWAG